MNNKEAPSKIQTSENKIILEPDLREKRMSVIEKKSSNKNLTDYVRAELRYKTEKIPEEKTIKTSLGIHQNPIITSINHNRLTVPTSPLRKPEDEDRKSHRNLIQSNYTKKPSLITNGQSKSEISKKEAYSKMLNNRVFWTKEEIENLWMRFKVTAEKIRHKIRIDFDSIYEAIKDNNEEYVYERLHNKEFKGFYKIELSKNKVLEYMLIKDRMKMLMRILEDKDYSFNKKYVFKFLHGILSKNSEQHLPTHIRTEVKGLELEEYEDLNLNKLLEEEVNRIMSDLVDHRLYHEAPHYLRILLWFLAHFENLQALRTIVNNHSQEFSKEVEIFGFNNYEDLKRFSSDIREFNETIILLLKFKMEELAM